MSLQDFYAKYGNSYKDKLGVEVKKSSKPEIDLIDLFSKANNENKKKRYTAQKNEIRNDWLLYYGNEVIKGFSDYESLKEYCEGRKIKFDLIS